MLERFAEINNQWICFHYFITWSFLVDENPVWWLSRNSYVTASVIKDNATNEKILIDCQVKWSTISKNENVQILHYVRDILLLSIRVVYCYGMLWAHIKKDKWNEGTKLCRSLVSLKSLGALQRRAMEHRRNLSVYPRGLPKSQPYNRYLEMLFIYAAITGLKYRLGRIYAFKVVVSKHPFNFK